MGKIEKNVPKRFCQSNNYTNKCCWQYSHVNMAIISNVCKQLVSECCDEGVSLYYQFVPTETETSTKV